MNYTDIHMHALFGVDDGAGDQKEMIEMIAMAYKSGTRAICMTPHYHPGYFRDNRQSSQDAFEELKKLAQELYPDLELYLGNELRYSPGCVSWLSEQQCRTMGGQSYVLVDFFGNDNEHTIVGGLEELLNSGYVPVLAHVERYRSLLGKEKLLRKLRGKGVMLQVNAGSVMGEFGLQTKVWARRLLQAELVDIVASDAHGTTGRTPDMYECCQYIEKKYGTSRAKRLFWDTPGQLLQKIEDEKGMDASDGW